MINRIFCSRTHVLLATRISAVVRPLDLMCQESCLQLIVLLLVMMRFVWMKLQLQRFVIKLTHFASLCSIDLVNLYCENFNVKFSLLVAIGLETTSTKTNNKH